MAKYTDGDNFEIYQESDSTGSIEFIGQDDKQIKMYSNLLEDYSSMNNDFEISFYNLENAFSETAPIMLALDPDKISVEISFEKSLVFTLKKNDYVLFFERFLDTNDDDEREIEVVFSHYLNDIKLPSFAGSYKLALLNLRGELASMPSHIFNK